MLHIFVVTFILLISYTKVHLFISCTKVQLIHFAIHFHLIHFTDHSLSHSHSAYLLLLIVHLISASLSLSFFKPIPSLGTRSVFRYDFNPKYILYHLKLNYDGIVVPCYFIRITTIYAETIWS